MGAAPTEGFDALDPANAKQLAPAIDELASRRNAKRPGKR